MCTGSIAIMKDGDSVFVGWQMSGNVKKPSSGLCNASEYEVWPTTLVHTSLSIAAEFSAWQLQISIVEYAYCRRRIHIASSREALDRFCDPHLASNTQGY